VSASKEVFIGLDYGDKTIGVAVSPNGRTALGIRTLRRKEAAALRLNLKELKAIMTEYGANHIILGYPKNMNGEESLRCELTALFKEKLERYFKKPVTLWDERLSTQAVSRGYNGNRKGYENNVDTMAAVYILQGFLDYKNNKEVIPMTTEPTPIDEFDEDDDSIIIVNDDGEEIPLQILSSRETEGGMYVLAAEGEDGIVSHFKCTPSGEDEITFEMIDGDHEDYERVFEMFKDDYAELGIDIEELDMEE